MLVLSRRKDEIIDIISPPGGIPEGTVIEVMLVDIRFEYQTKEHHARIGINAPSDVPIRRREVSRGFSGNVGT